MAMQAKQMQVGKWQAGRRGWHYDAAMQFFWRMVVTTLHDALQMDAEGRPTDEALLARDWFATSEMPAHGEARETFSFPECCHWLGVNADAERVAFLERIDAAGDFDTDEAWERLEQLACQEPESTEALFEPAYTARLVPALDQGQLIPIERPDKREPKVRVKTVVRVSDNAAPTLITGSLFEVAAATIQFSA